MQNNYKYPTHSFIIIYIVESSPTPAVPAARSADRSVCTQAITIYSTIL